jgi:hypothetical protein
LGFDLGERRDATLRASRGQTDIAINALTVEILSPAETELDRSMRSISSAGRSTRGKQSGKLAAAERSALNQALAKALAFKDAGKMA